MDRAASDGALTPSAAACGRLAAAWCLQSMEIVSHVPGILHNMTRSLLSAEGVLLEVTARLLPPTHLVLQACCKWLDFVFLGHRRLLRSDFISSGAGESRCAGGIRGRGHKCSSSGQGCADSGAACSAPFLRVLIIRLSNETLSTTHVSFPAPGSKTAASSMRLVSKQF